MCRLGCVHSPYLMRKRTGKHFSINVLVMDGSIPLVFMSKSGLSRAICIIWDVEDLPVVMVIAIRWSSGVNLGLRRDLKGKEEIANGINNVISIHFHQIKISTRLHSCLLLFLF